MKLEEQRIAIAEWCGWTSVVDSPARLDVVGCRPDEKDFGLVPLPDYLNDLNAMHEAERGMSNEMCDRFECFLQKIITTEELKWVGGQKNHIESASRYRWHATAAQRAEALLKTIGKWQDSTLHTKG